VECSALRFAHSFVWLFGFFTYGGEVNSYMAVVGKHERKRLLGRPRHRQEGISEMDCREIGWGDMDWIYLSEDRDKYQAFLNMVMSSGFP
jgi:hypothetical protein